MNPIIVNSLAESALFSEGAKNIMIYIDFNTGGLLINALATVFSLLSAFLLIFSRQIRMVLARAKRFIWGFFKYSTPQEEVEPISYLDEED